ncbi:hypothetical protein GCM10011371_29040 [Novosphingobium marinum]|uniref:Uncharacterized protein n=1 Tax=Novosphingobium marinum TaxID=1514948 RepID=A0A7Y9XYA8_9SPHN|nr:hypothetical protein [Novosphingobium marinum]NYH96834.1 hypothetical protein [Novosphingobium marinum]GGC39877.1 hypothetical protein GCM10011371_29040 [Novosphingobium marinum]
MLDALSSSRPGTCRIFFNTSGNVGTGQKNDPLDVLLVQYGYFCMAKNPSPQIPPDARAIYAQVKPDAPYGGRPDEPLSRAIVTHQKVRGTVQDGHVSRMRGGIGYYGDRGREGFRLLALSNNMYDMNKEVWPRLDKSTTCPPRLGQAIREMFRN